MTAQPAKITLWTIIVAICLGLGLVAGCCKETSSLSSVDTFTITVLQTSDVHHHAAGVGPQSDYTPLRTDDGDSVLGGYARLAALIDGVRSDAESRGEQVLLFDSGDFMMGTIYDLTDNDPAAFHFMNSMGYDAVTLGNHEFDWGIQRLSDLIDAALESGFSIPIVASNMITDANDPSDDDIEALVTDNVIVESTIIPVFFNVNVGVLGILGSGAAGLAPLAAPVTFNEDHAAIPTKDYSFLQGKVDALKAAGADIIVLLSHTGISSEGTGEDVQIAENVTGIDIILSGHTHVATQEALEKGASDTLIVAPGSYGAYLSRLDITFSKKQNKIVAYAFELLPVDDTVAGDDATDALVQSYQFTIDSALESLGVSADTVVSKLKFDLEKAELQETAFGDLVADALRQAATYLDTAGDPYDLAVIASGVIRDNLYQGKTDNILFSDVYNALPLGSSPYDDTAPGYPLMSVYVTAPEIANICEIAVSAAPLLGDDFYLNLSGIRYDYNPANDLFSRVTNVYLCDPTDMNTVGPGTSLDLSDDTTLYHVAVNLYALSMMDLATGSGLSIIPKDQYGIEVDSSVYADFRIDMSAGAGVQELKEWMALWHFLKTFYPPTGEGIPEDIYGGSGGGLGRAHSL